MTFDGSLDDGFVDSAKAEVAAKVRKLLTQAEDPAATPGEAQAFTLKAQELMTKYAISLAMVSSAASPEALVGTGWVIEGPYAGHKVHLVNAVCRTNDCRAVYASMPGGRKRIEVVGYANDIEWVQTLSQSLTIQLTAALAAATRQRPPYVHGRTWAVAFVEGFVAEVSGRLHAARRAAVAAATAAADGAGGAGGASGPSVALVLVAKERRVDDEFRVRHPDTRTVYSQTRLRSWEGYNPGRSAGARASLARGSVGGARRRLGA